MRHHTSLALAVLLSAVALTVAACGGMGEGAGDMDHGATGKDGAAENGDKSGMKGMGRSGMERGSGGAAPGVLIENGRYSDERFIDAMVPYHRGAVEMANVALDRSDNLRIEKLAGGIVEAQEREISQMQTWRNEWYPER